MRKFSGIDVFIWFLRANPGATICDHWGEYFYENDCLKYRTATATYLVARNPGPRI